MDRLFSEKEYECLEAKRRALIDYACKGEAYNLNGTAQNIAKSYPKFERSECIVDDFEKNLLTFWINYGPHDRLDDRASLELLKKWIEILYGREILSSLCLDDLISEISEKQLRANRDFYAQKDGAMKFIFYSPCQQAIEKALVKLGVYES